MAYGENIINSEEIKVKKGDSFLVIIFIIFIITIKLITDAIADIILRPIVASTFNKKVII